MAFAVMKNSMLDSHAFDSNGSSRQMVGIQATLSFLIIDLLLASLSRDTKVLSLSFLS